LLKKINNKIYTKVGILGGTFDPPHKGHLQISKIAIKKLKLNKFIWVITKKNPLKRKPHLSINERIKLSKKIINNKKILVTFLDKKIKSNKTFDLLTYIKKKHQKAQLYFLIGADNLISFHKWKYWEKITQLAKIVIYPRQNYSLKSLKKIVLKKLNKEDFIYLKSKKINISSSIIRKFW
jgi:nicotinate-nucleotide adenylyltransferase